MRQKQRKTNHDCSPSVRMGAVLRQGGDQAEALGRKEQPIRERGWGGGGRVPVPPLKPRPWLKANMKRQHGSAEQRVFI